MQMQMVKWPNDYKRYYQMRNELVLKLDELKQQISNMQQDYVQMWKEFVDVEKNLEIFDEGHSESCCVACGKSVTEAEHTISGGQYLYADEGEWVCSDECFTKVEESEDNKLF